MSVTSDRLRALREEANMTQEELSQKLGIKRASYAKYETGATPMGGDLVVQLAEFYGVTTDYLLGRSAFPPGLLADKGIKYIKMFDEFERRGMTPERVLQILDELSELGKRYSVE